MYVALMFVVAVTVRWDLHAAASAGILVRGLNV